MSNVAFLRDASAAPSGTTAIGVAAVTSVRADSLDARMAKDGRTVRATIALAVPYEPAVGDDVLLVGDGENHYVIGVIRGAGRTSLAFPGDVDVRAVGGTLRLSGDRGVEIDAPELSIRARKIATFADSVVEHATSVVQHVRELLTLRAGQTHSVVEGSSYSQSKSTSIVSEEKVTLNGKSIYLG